MKVKLAPKEVNKDQLNYKYVVTYKKKSNN